MTPRANAAKMLASGRRNADRFHGELFAIYVMQHDLTPEDRMALERNVTLARAQQAQVEILEGKDPDQDDSRLRPSPRHHADFRRPQPPPHLACASGRHSARSADSRRRRDRRARVSAVSAMGDAATRSAQGIPRLCRRRRQDLPDAVRSPRAEGARGVDVVIGYFEPHGRQETIALSEGLGDRPTKGRRVSRRTRSRRWTPRPFFGGIRRWRSSTSFPTPMSPDRPD